MLQIIIQWMKTRRNTQIRALETRRRFDRLTGGRIFYGWFILGIASLVIFVANGIFFRGFNVFFVPVQESLRLRQEQTALVFSLARAQGEVLGPVAAWLMDRFGGRAVVIVGLLVAGAGYLAFSRVDNYLGFALIYLGLIAAANAISVQHGLFNMLNMWFIRNRGLALAIFATVASVGAAALVPLVNIMIIKFSWEQVSLIIGLGYVVLMAPLGLWLHSSPENVGLHPDGDRPRPPITVTGAASRNASRGSVDFTIREAVRTSAFWMIVLGQIFRRAGALGILINLQPIVFSKGVGDATFGFLLMILFIVNIVSRIPVGWASDKLPRSLVVAGCLALEGVATLFLLTGEWEGSAWAIYAYMILAGVGDASGFLLWATVGDFYGRTRFAAMRGMITFSSSWMMILAPWFVGWWGERHDTYDFPLTLAAIFMGVAAVCLLLVRRPVKRDPSTASSSPSS